MKRLNIHISFLLLFLVSAIAWSQEREEGTETGSYEPGEGLHLRSKNGHEVNIVTYIQPAFEDKYYTDANVDATRYRLRRGRLRMEGKAPNPRLSYRVQFDLTGNGEFEEQEGLYLLDAVVNYQLFDQLRVSFGQRATYTDNRELFMYSNTLQLVERSRVTSAFASIREFGLFVRGDFRTGGTSRLRPYFVLTNGDGGNVFDRDRGGLKVGGRIDFLPFGTFTNMGQFRQVDVMRELTPKLVFGANFSHNNGMSSRRGRGSGDIIYLNDFGEEALPDYTKFGVDFMFKYRGFSAIGEFVKTMAHVPSEISQRVRNDGSIANTFLVNGIQDVENYVKGRMMLGEGYNIQMGYLFKSGFSVDARYTHLKADEHSFLNNPTFYSRPNYYTLGVTQYMSKFYGAKIQTDLTYVQGDNINDINSNPIDGNEWILRIMLTFTM